MIGGVVLAAGASTRAGTIKALATFEGEPFVTRMVRALSEGGCDEVVVVLGPPHAEAIAPSLAGAARVDNPDPSRGMLSSLQLGLRDEWDAAVVALVDHPRVAPATVRALVEAWRASGEELVRPRCDGRTGHPYLVARSVFDALRDADLAQGPRPVYATRSRRDVDVDDPAIHDDLDTAEAIAAIADPP